MKKYSVILFASAMFALTACGSGSTTKETTDSTAASVDTAGVQSVDTTKVVDSTSVGH